MTTSKPLLPPPGSYKLPKMQFIQFTSSDEPDYVQMIFRTERENAGQTEQLTIAVPLQVLDAAGMLRSLRILQDQGIVPIVVAPERPTTN